MSDLKPKYLVVIFRAIFLDESLKLLEWTLCNYKFK